MTTKERPPRFVVSGHSLRQNRQCECGEIFTGSSKGLRALEHYEHKRAVDTKTWVAWNIAYYAWHSDRWIKQPPSNPHYVREYHLTKEKKS